MILNRHHTRIYAQREDYNRCVSLHLVLDRPDRDKIAVAQAVTFVEIEPDAAAEQPMLRVHPEVAQHLMDELWRIGFRPTEGTGSAGSLAATERHLKDMQRIAFQLLPAPARLSEDDVLAQLGPLVKS